MLAYFSCWSDSHITRNFRKHILRRAFLSLFVLLLLYFFLFLLFPSLYFFLRSYTLLLVCTTSDQGTIWWNKKSQQTMFKLFAFPPESDRKKGNLIINIHNDEWKRSTINKSCTYLSSRWNCVRKWNKKKQREVHNDNMAVCLWQIIIINYIMTLE